MNDNFIELKQALQKFQADRIADTYRDFKDDPEFNRIGDFFFERLYAPGDFSFRDQSIRKLQRVLNGVVHGGMTTAVARVIELHELSDELDDRMVAEMAEKGIGPDISDAQYNDVYRRLDNYGERIYQIGLTVDCCRDFHRLSKMRVVGVSLKTVRITARVLGVGKIVDFIHEGYTAFKRIDNIDYFLETVEERELARHDAVWHGHGR